VEQYWGGMASTPEVRSSRTEVSGRPWWVELLLLAGAVGPLLFIVVLLVEGATRPHYNAWHHAMSTLALGDLGWMQVANFIVLGVLLLGYAFGLRQVLHPGRGSTWVPIMMGVSGLCLIGAGVSVTDPGGLGYPPGESNASTLHGGLHLLFSNFAILAILVACVILALRFAQTPGWRGWAVYSVVTVILMIVFVIATSVAGTSDPNSPFGLYQRLTTFAGWAWIALVALRLLTRELPAGR
jgi:hypothetical membrane protein